MISTSIWNARGIRTSGAIERLKILKHIHKLPFIVVLEPFLDNSHVNFFKLQLSMHYVAFNVNDTIWIFWDKEVTTSVVDQDEQQLTLQMRHVENDNIFYIIVVYAKCKPVMRRPLWYALRLKSISYDNHWCVIGDFSVITSVEEKIGAFPIK